MTPTPQMIEAGARALALRQFHESKLTPWIVSKFYDKSEACLLAAFASIPVKQADGTEKTEQ